MNILVPLNRPDAFERYREAGASEFYLGFVDEAWTERFGAQADLNRLSGFGGQANALGFEELCEAAPSITGSGAQLYVPFNAGIYTQEQHGFIAKRYLPALAAAGVAGVILSGPELIGSAKEQGLQAVASTMCGIYNADIARFYEQAGADRIILPREVTLGEMETIRAAVPNLSFEVFLMRNGCIFSDSHCLGCHRGGRYSLCRDLHHGQHWNESLFGYDARNDAMLEQNGADWQSLFYQACGLCALWRLEQMGGSAYKIVGRCDDEAEIAADIRLVAENLRIARECATEAEYLEKMQRPSNADKVCPSGLNCYYPEVFDEQG